MALPPWDPFHLPANSFDILREFRQSTRAVQRSKQMISLLSARSSLWYCMLHPEKRRKWLSCIPAKRIEMKIITRVRSGYCGVGYFDKVQRLTLPCPACNSSDDVEHLLLKCQVYKAQREHLLSEVSKISDLEPTLGLLLGFHVALSTADLRRITGLTARYVLAIGRSI